MNGFADCAPLRAETKNDYIVKRADDPGQVKPGDVVTIPDFVINAEDGATEDTHNFVKRGMLAMLRFVHGSSTAELAKHPTLTFLNISKYITNKAGVGDGDKTFPGSAVRNFNANADKDPDVFKIEVFDINAAGDLTVKLEVLRPTYNAAGKVTGHTQFPDAIRAARKLTPTASKQGATQRFRTCYLRLVVDEVDKAAAADQTLLASDMFDPADPDSKKVEILDQKVKAFYIIKSCPANPKCKSTVSLPIGKDRRRLRLAIHVLNNKPAAEGGTPVIPLADAERRVWTWFRRVYAQVNIAPKLVETTRAVDPPQNLVSISNDNGLPVAGWGWGLLNKPRFGFRINASIMVSQVIGPITPKIGDKPITTATALAALVKDPYEAVVRENPARVNDPIDFKSADIVITAKNKQRVIIDQPISEDATQTLKIGRADSTNLETTFVPEDNANGNVGTLQERAIARNHDTGDDRMDIFVVVKFSDNGLTLAEALSSGHDKYPKRTSISKLKYSAFLSAKTMDSMDTYPFALSHEVCHAAGEIGHTQNNPSQLMSPTSSETNVVKGTKRIRDGAVKYDNPVKPVDYFNLAKRLRKEAAPLLEPW